MAFAPRVRLDDERPATKIGRALSSSRPMCMIAAYRICPVERALAAAMQNGTFRITRIQKNFVARQERQLLTWLCARLPQWMTPDRLTILGVAGAVLTFGSYVASRVDPAFFWLASVGLLVHWLGDSLDGSLARFRHIERPIYGYFLDHTVDAITNLTIMAGLGLTRHVRMDAALFALIGYYLLCIYVFINNHLSGVLQLSFLGFGPTELRLALIAINTGMFVFGHVGMTVDGLILSVYDLVLLTAGGIFTAIFLAKMSAGIRDLREPRWAGAGRDPGRGASK